MQTAARDGAPNAPVAVGLLEGIGQWHGRQGSVGARQGLDHPVDERGPRPGPRTVVDEHRPRRIHRQCLQAGRYALLPGGTTTVQDADIETRQGAAGGGGLLGRDDRQHPGDAGMPGERLHRPPDEWPAPDDTELLGSVAPGSFAASGRDDQRIDTIRWRHARASWRIISAPRSAIIMVGAFVFPCVIVGITDASATRKPRIPCTRSRSSTTPSRPMWHVPTG